MNLSKLMILLNCAVIRHNNLHNLGGEEKTQKIKIFSLSKTNIIYNIKM